MFGESLKFLFISLSSCICLMLLATFFGINNKNALAEHPNAGKKKSGEKSVSLPVGQSFFPHLIADSAIYREKDKLLAIEGLSQLFSDSKLNNAYGKTLLYPGKRLKAQFANVTSISLIAPHSSDSMHVDPVAGSTSECLLIVLDKDGVIKSSESVAVAQFQIKSVNSVGLQNDTP